MDGVEWQYKLIFRRHWKCDGVAGKDIEEEHSDVELVALRFKRLTENPKVSMIHVTAIKEI